MNALEIKGLSRSFKNFELKDVSFVLPEGCIMGMVGENGAGKSTTIKLILNMLKKDSGEIKLFGKDFDDSVKEDVGAVLDDLGSPDCLDIKKTEKVMKGIFKNWESDTYFDLCQRLRIPYDKTIKEFSKGKRAKLAIVIVLISIGSSKLISYLHLETYKSKKEPLSKLSFLFECKHSDIILRRVLLPLPFPP